MKGTLPALRNDLIHSLALIALLGAGLLVNACRPGPALPGLEADFRLVSVNHQNLPTKLVHGPANLEIRQGSFNFSSNGTCQSRITFVAPDGREMVRETAASYTRTGSELSMKWKGAGRTMGHLAGDTFTMTNEGAIFTYRP